MRQPRQGSKEAKQNHVNDHDQTSLGRTRVVAEGAQRRREAGQQVCGQEAECGWQRKMTEAIRVGRQENKVKMGRELGAGGRGCFKPGEGKMYLAGP